MTPDEPRPITDQKSAERRPHDIAVLFDAIEHDQRSRHRQEVADLAALDVVQCKDQKRKGGGGHVDVIPRKPREVGQHRTDHRQRENKDRLRRPDMSAGVPNQPQHEDARQRERQPPGEVTISEQVKCQRPHVIQKRAVIHRIVRPGLQAVAVHVVAVVRVNGLIVMVGHAFQIVEAHEYPDADQHAHE